jgi:hypothetical protein
MALAICTQPGIEVDVALAVVFGVGIERMRLEATVPGGKQLLRGFVDHARIV